MKQKPCSQHKRKHPKTHLRLPDLEYSKSAVLGSLTSTDGRRGYGHAMDEFVDWYCSEPGLALNRTSFSDIAAISKLDDSHPEPSTLGLGPFGASPTNLRTPVS